MAITKPVVGQANWAPVLNAALDALDTAVSGKLTAASNLSDLQNPITARGNLGLGSAAQVNTGTTVGTVPVLETGGKLNIARLASGTPDGTKFIRDDGTLQSLPVTGLDPNLVGAASGVAPLDSAARVPVVNLPLHLSQAALDTAYGGVGTGGSAEVSTSRYATGTVFIPVTTQTTGTVTPGA